ncbi:heterokaryon incompatibility protein-domain-containing protein [Dactylonectria estremocensis]|uniref:Heterokaryon incompatibility protein-domain-containing protein n=1 Tax=Dactylonectria estremocensis TaxID=1079267 RepID=A0A9P9DN89_9HYPO|nr:heterokaryon incompatibility protein-domain-containing protein [Dactylonectria estremocensis]
MREFRAVLRPCGGPATPLCPATPASLFFHFLHVLDWWVLYVIDEAGSLLLAGLCLMQRQHILTDRWGLKLLGSRGAKLMATGVGTIKNIQRSKCLDVGQSNTSLSSHMMDKLCQYCLGLVSLHHSPGASDYRTVPRYLDVNHYRTVDHQPNVEALIQSAKDCSLCKVIQEYWPLHELRKRFPDIKEESFGSLELSFDLNEPRFFGSGAAWGLLVGTIHTPWHAFTMTFKLTITTCLLSSRASQSSLWSGNDSSMEEKSTIIRSWFAECSSHHPECTPPTHQYPRRLVEMGIEGTNLRLVDTKHEISEKARYATLSYCWGPVRPLTTTKDNVELFSNRIPVESLPRTFHESIAITRELGIRYIWIDSLCIIQDDLGDWRREAARMKDIYAGSSITISASDAKNSTQGCFVDNYPQIFDSRGTHIAQLSIVPPNNDIRLLVRVHEGDIRRRAETSVLSTRGWNLQEQLLSHRVVHCMRPEIHWKCHRNYNIESGLCFSGRELMRFWSNSVPAEATTSELHEMWCDWMEDYSRRNFTVTKDRICALAGIVQHYGKRTGHKHVLACWEETLVTELLWMRTGELIDPSLALPGIPSWSWLSRTGEVYFDFWHRLTGTKNLAKVDDHTKVVEASVTWTGESMVSDLQATNLIVEGPIRQFRLRVDLKGRDFNPPYMNVGDEEPDFSTHPIPWRCAGQFDLEKDREDDLFTCLLVRSVTSSVKNTLYSLQETCLLLLPEPNSQGETYRRVGIAMFRSNKTEFSSAEKRKIRLI